MKNSAVNNSVCTYAVITCYRITKFLEKPLASETSSRLASPVFYCLKRDTLPSVSTFTQQHLLKKERALGKFIVSIVT